MSEKTTIVNRSIFWKNDWWLTVLKEKKERIKNRRSRYENGILKEFLSAYYETQIAICDSMIEKIQIDIEDRIAELYCSEGIVVIRTDGLETL